MKIAYLITKANWGGAQRYVFDLATMAKKQGHDVTVIAGLPKTVLAERLKEAGIKTIIIEHMGRDIHITDEFRVFFTCLKIFRQEKFDIVHVNSSKAGGLGALAAQLARTPHVIFTAHGFPFLETSRNIISRTIIAFLTWLTVLIADKTILISPYDNRLKKYFIFCKHKMILICNGIHKEAAYNKKEYKEKLLHTHNQQYTDDLLIIGSVGELHKNKRHDRAILAFAEAYKTQKNIRLFIAGDGEEKEALSRLITKLDLNNVVTLVGFVDPLPFIKALDVFLLTSDKEGLPYVLLEAGALGVPIIGTHVGSIPDVILPNGGIVAEKTTESCTEAILALIQNENKRKESGLAIKNAIETKFSLEQMIEKTFALYGTTSDIL